MSTHDEVDPKNLLTASKDATRERELPLVFFSIALAVCAATWFGVPVRLSSLV